MTSVLSLDPDDIRARLRDSLADEPPWYIDGDESRRQPPSGHLTPAAVLLALVPRPTGPALVLTERAAHLTAHGGQISLPGGRMEPDDVSTAATALRESDEEIGLARDAVEMLGSLRAYDTITGFRIYPIVGWVAVPPVAWRPDPAEVADVFEVPLDFVVDPANHRRDFYLRDGRRRHFFVLPYQNRYIWGATAGMLVNFARTLAA